MSLCCFNSGGLSFPLCVVFFVFLCSSFPTIPPGSLDIVEGQGRRGGAKMAKIHYGVKTSRKWGEPMVQIQSEVKLVIFKYALLPWTVMADFGQSNLPIRFWPICVVCVLCLCVVFMCVVCVVLWCCGGVQNFRGFVQDFGAPPLPRTALSGTAQNFALFFSLARHTFHSFSSLGSRFVEFWWHFSIFSIFHFLSFSFIFIHFLSFSDIFFRDLSCSFTFYHFLSFSFIFFISFHFLSVSFSFFQFLSVSFSFFQFLCWVLKIWFFLHFNFVTISLDSSYEKKKLIKKKTFGPSFPFFLLFFLQFFVFFLAFYFFIFLIFCSFLHVLIF